MNTCAFISCVYYLFLNSAFYYTFQDVDFICIRRRPNTSVTKLYEIYKKSNELEILTVYTQDKICFHIEQNGHDCVVTEKFEKVFSSWSNYSEFELPYKCKKQKLVENSTTTRRTITLEPLGTTKESSETSSENPIRTETPTTQDTTKEKDRDAAATTPEPPQKSPIHLQVNRTSTVETPTTTISPFTTTKSHNQEKSISPTTDPKVGAKMESTTEGDRDTQKEPSSTEATIIRTLNPLIFKQRVDPIDSNKL